MDDDGIPHEDDRRKARKGKKYEFNKPPEVPSPTGNIKRKRGRPTRGNLPRFEKMHLAQWIDEETERQRQQGSKAPAKDAGHEAYKMERGANATKPNQSELDTIKSYAKRGRQDLKAVAAASTPKKPKKKG